jgi:hypothetical protein
MDAAHRAPWHQAPLDNCGDPAVIHSETNKAMKHSEVTTHRATERHDRNYRFSYPHFFNSGTVQQPVSIQASYRFWQIRCVPQFDRACEQVTRSWADATL